MSVSHGTTAIFAASLSLQLLLRANHCECVNPISLYSPFARI